MTSEQHPDREVNPHLLDVQDSMLDGLSQLADYFGFSKVMGQLYGVLLLNGEPMSLDDLMDRLDISKASVSMNMRTLEQLGMVRQVWLRGRGDRRKYYEAETDLLQILTNILKGRELREVDRALNVLQDNIKTLEHARGSMNAADQHTADLYIDRITEMQAFFRFAQLVMTTILGRLNELKVDQISRIDLG
ncbi:MAG: helix-turn-helix domain-containing protein [Chloroflexi bacterium]|nr:helix-turn-helix domain-containing protein [Chloroflexota bacterium]